jgi:hypothetical protein
MNKLEIINSKWISGPYNLGISMPIDYNVFGKMWLKFKRYAPQYFYNGLVLGEKQSNQLGTKEVQTFIDERGNEVKGEIIKDRFNISAGHAILTLLGTAKSLYKEGYPTFNQIWNDPEKGKYYREQIHKVTADMVVALVPLLFMTALMDDKDLKKFKKSQVYYAYWYGMADAIGYLNLKGYVNMTLNPIIAFKNLGNLFNALSFAVQLDFSRANKELSKAIAAKRLILDPLIADWVLDNSEEDYQQRNK